MVQHTINRTYEMGQPLLTLEGVNLTLGKGEKARLILRDVDLKVNNIIRPGMKQGQVKGLLGPSGIGKTQLFKIISGTQEPDSGTVLVGAEQKPPLPGRVGVVTQHYRVFRHMTVLQNLVYAARISGLSAAEAKDKALHYLEEFGLSNARNQWPYGEISGGQRQRLAILQQILAGHSFICMDEPFSGLDVNQVENVSELITRLTSDDELLTIIVITHDIGAAIAVSDELWIMGKQRDEATGAFYDGARVIYQEDLIAADLAWDPGIRQNPRFLELEAAIVDRFRTLC